MTAPTETGHIVAYLSLDDTEWRRSIERAKRDIAALKREDIDIRVRVDDNGALAALQAIRGELRGLRRMDRTNLNIRTNARQVGSDMSSARRQTNLLVDSIVTLGSAAVPVGAVAAGAIAGLLPVAVATIAGIAGVRDMMKSGAIETSQYAGDVAGVKDELTTLKAITAVPLLDGLHRGMQEADPLFKVINTDAHQMAEQIGTIAGNAVPALLNVLTQMSPLFTSIGNELVRGSEGLLRWSKSSNGVRDFVSYVQSELPAVEHTLGSLLHLIVRLGEGLGPVGHLTVTSIGVLADALNSLPLPVLQTLLPMLIAVRVAMLAYRGVSAVMAGVNAAYARTAGTLQAYGATSMSANLQAAAASTASAATIAAEKAAQAQAELRAAAAAVTAAEEQVAAASLVGEAAVAEARVVLTAAQTEMTAKARVAAVTAAAATRSAGAAEAAALRQAAAGKVAATGWSAALGPIGALVLGLSLLGMAFMGSGDDTNSAAEAQQNYAESVKQSTDALSRANVQATVKTLTDTKALNDLNRITTGTNKFTTTQGELIAMINGKSAPAFDAYIDRLQKYHDETELTVKNNERSKGLSDDTKRQMYEQVKASDLLIAKTKTARDTLLSKIQSQKLEIAAQRAATEQYAGGGTAVSKMAAALGVNRDAYLDATAAARKNEDETRAQTAAYQAANDAASLFKQTLDLLNGENLDVATAQTNAAAANLRAADAVKQNGSAIKGNSKEALANQQAIQQSVQQAQAYSEAVGKQTGSSEKAVAAYKRSKTALEDQLRATGKLTPAMQAYIDKLFALGDVKVPPTKFDIDSKPAKAKAEQIQAQIDAIKQGKVPGLKANSAQGKAIIAQLQAAIDRLKQTRPATLTADTQQAQRALFDLQALLANIRSKTITVTTNTVAHGTGQKSGRTKSGAVYEAKGGPVRRADGGDVGPVTGPGNGTSDDVPAVLMVNGRREREYKLSNGEWIMNTAATTKNRSALEAANHGAQLAVVHHMATGGGVGQIKKTGGKGKSATYTYNGTTYDTVKQANAARAKDIKANIKLIAQIDDSGIKKFEKSLHGTLADAKAGFKDLYESVKKVGASDSLLRNLRTMNAALDKTIAHRDKLKAQLGTPTSTSKTAYEKLEQIQSDRKSLTDSVASTGRGVFDVSESKGPDDAAPTGGSMEANAIQAANLIERFYAGIKTLAAGALGKSQTGKGMLREIIEKGPGAYPQVQALLKDTPADLNRLIGTQGRINRAAADLGSFAGATFYGADQTKAQSAVNKLRNDIAADDRRADRQGERIGAKVAHAIAALKQDIYLDGKKVGKGTRTGNNKNDRRN